MRLAAAALAGEPSSDDELLTAGALDLQPVAGASSGLVAGLQALGEDALESLLGGGLQQLGAVADEVLGHLQARAAQLQAAPAARAGRS